MTYHNPSDHTSEVSTAAAEEAGAPILEITSAMIDAGVEAILPFEDTFEEAREAVGRIFKAMVKASLPG